MGRNLIQLRIHIPGYHIRIRDPGIGLGRGGRRIRPNRHARRSGLNQLIQLFHRQGSQGVKIQRTVESLHLLHQGSLSHRNLAGLRLLFQCSVGSQSLAEHGRTGGGIGQGGIHFRRQRRLQPGSPLHVIIFHRNQDRSGNPVQIPVLQQRPHNGVDRHSQLGLAQVHPFQDLLRLGIEGLRLQNNLLLIDLKLNAGVDVQRHHGGHRVARLPAVQAKPPHSKIASMAAAAQAVRGRRRREGRCEGNHLVTVLRPATARIRLRSCGAA